MKNLAIIPARGGSKGIRKKNIQTLRGLPLIAWTIRAAQRATTIDRIIVSTDDLEIAQISSTFNVEIPFIRPKEISQDKSGAVEVCRHAIEHFQEAEGKTPHCIIYLQPTSPFRSSFHIDQAVEKFSKNDYDTLVSVTKVPHNMNAASQMHLADDTVVFSMDKTSQIFNRQSKTKKSFARNGPAILITKATNILNNALYGTNIGFLEMDKVCSLDIDDPIDLEIAECLFPLVESELL